MNNSSFQSSDINVAYERTKKKLSRPFFSVKKKNSFLRTISLIVDQNNTLQFFSFFVCYLQTSVLIAVVFHHKIFNYKRKRRYPSITTTKIEIGRERERKKI
jgi:hypothetical protein